MHKSELEGMTLAELTTLAGEIGAELSDDQTTLIYNILDAQSLQAPVEAKPKKRGRKSKAEKAALEEELNAASLVSEPTQTEEEELTEAQAEADEAAAEAEVKESRNWRKGN